MTQITLDLDQDTVRRMNKAAEAAGLTVDGWVARLVQSADEDLVPSPEGQPAQPHSTGGWPEEVVALVGSWGDDVPMAEEIRATEVADLPREPF